MKKVRKIIQIDEEKCNGCGQCILSCAEGALEIVDGKAKVISDNLCDGLGACLGECPEDALHIVEKEADAFDEEAVEKHLSAQKNKKNKGNQFIAGGCPSAKLQTFAPEPSMGSGLKKVQTPSALTHWPVQIRLVPPHAPFLKNADLLVVADCVPIAFSGFHERFLKGKAVTMGCPKFDDADLYIEKFSDIFKTAGLKSITVVIMEVPCCSGLPMIVKKGLELSKEKIPMKIVVVSTRGEILSEQEIF